MKQLHFRAFLTILTAALLVLLSGCGAGSGGKGGAVSPDGIVISGSVKILIGDVAESETELTARLGEPVRRRESRSCIAVGTDVELDYEGFSLTLYPCGETAHVVGSIKISSPEYATATGIRPGDNISLLDTSPYTLRSHYGNVNEPGNFTYFMGDSAYFLIASTDASGSVALLILGSSEFQGE